MPCCVLSVIDASWFDVVLSRPAGLYGVKSVMMSNCRGFSIELATALTVIFAARFGELAECNAG
jgi:hypothetical protein